MRVAEEDKGWRQTTATAWAGRAARLLSPAAARHCVAARDRVYLRAADLARWSPRPGRVRVLSTKAEPIRTIEIANRVPYFHRAAFSGSNFRKLISDPMACST